MKMDAPCQIRQRPGAIGRYPAEELLYIISGTHPQYACELAIDRMLHNYVGHLAPGVHNGVEFGPHLLRSVDAGHPPFHSGRAAAQHISFGRGQDLRAGRPQQGDVPHNNLPAHGKLFGQRGRRIYLTEAGLAMDQALMQLAAQTEEVLLAGLDENEQAELNRLLQRVLENMQACRDSSRGGEET